MTGFLCPVCGFPDLYEPPHTLHDGASHESCPSCGFEFGYHDDDQGWTYGAWRTQWIADGMPWHADDEFRPDGWDPAKQLANVAAGPR